MNEGKPLSLGEIIAEALGPGDSSETGHKTLGEILQEALAAVETPAAKQRAAGPVVTPIGTPIPSTGNSEGTVNAQAPSPPVVTPSGTPRGRLSIADLKAAAVAKRATG